MAIDDWAELEAELDRVMSAQPRDAAARVPVLRAAVTACRADPAARDIWEEVELLDELVDELEALERWDEAIATMQEAITAGWNGAPDGRCRIAELLMRSGRIDEAAPIWAQVQAEMPRDVWVYNNAGLEYQAVGNDEEALRWLTSGLEVAMDTGDPERLVGQLADLRDRSLTALGRGGDELQRAADSFLRQPPPPISRRAYPPTPSRERPHQSSQLGQTSATMEFADTVSAAARSHDEHRPAGASSAAWPPGIPLVLAWFPASDFDAAVALGPDLLTELPAEAALSHPQYSRSALEGPLRGYAAVGAPRLHVAAIRVQPYLAWCADHARDAALASTRASYAGALFRTGDPGVRPWPPGRNERCWCGSGRKYKQCCGSVAAA